MLLHKLLLENDLGIKLQHKLVIWLFQGCSILEAKDFHMWTSPSWSTFILWSDP